MTDQEALERTALRRRAARRRLLAGGGALLAAMVAVSAWAGLAASGADVVLHRGLDGEPTRTGDITALLVLLPVVATLLTALLSTAVSAGGSTYWETSEAEAADPMVQAWFGIGVVGLLAGLHTVILLDATEVLGDPVRPLLALMGAFAVLFGALLARERSGESLLQIAVNLPRPPGPRARRRLRRAVGGGFALTGATTIIGGMLAPVWVPTVVLLAGLATTCAAALVVSLRDQT